MKRAFLRFSGGAAVLIALALLLTAWPRLLPHWRESSITDYLLVMLTGLYVLVTTSQLNVLHGQLAEMRRSHRPWVNASIAVAEPMKFDPEGARVGINVTVKN